MKKGNIFVLFMFCKFLWFSDLANARNKGKGKDTSYREKGGPPPSLFLLISAGSGRSLGSGRRHPNCSDSEPSSRSAGGIGCR